MLKSKIISLVVIIGLSLIFIIPKSLSAQNQTYLESTEQISENSLFPILNRVDFDVKIKKNLEAEISITLSEITSTLPALSWPIPKDAYQIKVKSNNELVEYNLIHSQEEQIINFFFTENPQISYIIKINPQKEKDYWQVFLNLVNEPRIQSYQASLKITLPEQAELFEPRLYLIHGGKILKEEKYNNIYGAQLSIEPFSTLSWETNTSFPFKVSFIQNTTLYIENHISQVVFLLLAIIVLAGGGFYAFYFFFLPYKFQAYKVLPKTFLENSFIFYKDLSVESIAATILDWAQKQLIVFVEKRSEEFSIGKNKQDPELNPLEKKLWDFVFQNQTQINLKKLDEEAETEVIPKELIDLKQTALTQLEQEYYISKSKWGPFDLKTLLMILALACLIFFAIASWINNIPWLIIPAIALNLLIIFIGEKIPIIFFLSAKGKMAKQTLEKIKKKISSAQKNLNFAELLRFLPSALFFNEEEQIIKLSEHCPAQPIPFMISYNPLDLPSENLRKTIKASLKLSKYLYSLSRL